MVRMPFLFVALPALVTCAWSGAGAQSGRSGVGALAVETTGASIGSLAGAVAAYQILNATRGACGTEDLSCLLGRLGVLGIASVGGAVGGGYLAGRAVGTGPSAWGSVLGAILGVGGGVAVAKGLDEIGAKGRLSQALGYSITQGLLTAIGSRLLSEG